METPFQSKLSRKPWILSEEPDSARTGDRTERYLVLLGHIALLFRKFCEVSLLAAFIAVPLFYILSIRQDLIIESTHRVIAWATFLDDPRDAVAVLWSRQLAPYLTATAPVLEMKKFVWLACLGLVLPIHIVARLFEGIFRVPVFGPLADGLIPGSRRLRLGMLAGGLAFLVWAVATMILLPPPIPEDSTLGGAGMGGGGFFHSLGAWGQLAGALVFFVVLEDAIRTRRFAFKLMGMMLLTGAICAAMAVVQQFRPAWLGAVWVQFDDALFRNNYGSFIGHNTGLSSFLIAPVMLGIGVLLARLEAFRGKRRVALMVALPTFAYALILAQSRAVIPILGACILMFAYGASRREALRVPRRVWGIVALAAILLVASQLIPGRANPFARREITLSQRLADVSPRRLLADTRVRILAIGAGMVAEKPLFGHSFGSFQYTYPTAQRRYFEQHPRSSLTPWARRSMHAHNEYLQTMIETGLVGTTLALAALACAIVLGGRTLRATLERPWVLVQWAIIAAIAGILAHAAADFPFRIPPVTLHLLGLIALWTAGERLWLTPMAPAEPERAEHKLPTLTGAGQPARIAAVLAVGAACVVASYGSAQLVSRVGGRWYSGRVLTNMASSLLESSADRARSPEPADQAEAANSLGEAEFLSREATFFLPADGDVLYLRSRVKAAIGREAIRAARGIMQSGDMPRGESRLAVAREELGSALSLAGQAISETLFHSVYFQRALIQQMLGEYAPTDAERQVRFNAAVSDFRTTIALNPAEADAYPLLFRLLDKRRTREDEEEMVRLLGMMHHFMPGELDRIFFAEVLDNLALGDYGNGYRLMKRISRAVPSSRRYSAAFASTAIRAGAYEEARETLTTLSRTQAEAREVGAGELYIPFVMLSARVRQFEAALESLEKYSASGGGAEEPVALAIRMELLRRVSPPRTAEAEQVEATLQKLAARDPQVLHIAGATILETFNDPAAALPWLERRIALRDPAPDLPALMLCARCLLAAGRVEEARLIEKRMVPLAQTIPQREILLRFREKLGPVPPDPMRKRGDAPAGVSP